MTALEAQEMFDSEVEPWIKRGNSPVADTIMGRWVSNLMLTTQETALKILHDLQEAPGKKLDVRSFRTALPRRPQAGARVMGTDCQAWVVCLDPPETKQGWKGQRWPVFTPSCDRGNQERVGLAASAAAGEIQGREGGRWSGQVEQVPDEIPDGMLMGKRAAAEARRLTLAGPDTPGRRFLLSLKGGTEAPDLVKAAVKALPVPPKPPTQAKVLAGLWVGQAKSDGNPTEIRNRDEIRNKSDDLPPVNADEADAEAARQAHREPVYDPPSAIDEDLRF